MGEIWFRTTQKWISSPLEETKWYSRWWFQLCFIFTPILGEMIDDIDVHIFQMGWFNHQLVLDIGGIPRFWDVARPWSRNHWLRIPAEVACLLFVVCYQVNEQKQFLFKNMLAYWKKRVVKCPWFIWVSRVRKDERFDFYCLLILTWRIP